MTIQRDHISFISYYLNGEAVSGLIISRYSNFGEEKTYVIKVVCSKAQTETLFLIIRLQIEYIYIYKIMFTLLLVSKMTIEIE